MENALVTVGSGAVVECTHMDPDEKTEWTHIPCEYPTEEAIKTLGA